jgi:transcriptional regulator with XRE-family HTH domain
MNDVIKQIRNHLGISQEQLAQMLGTSPITVNRWENKKTQPSQMAQKQLYELCKDRGMDLADYIVASVQMQSSDNEMILYHGSRNGLKGAIQPISRSRCDFGKGFYMGTDPLQPLTLICNEDKPVFYTLQMKMKGLKCLNVEIGIDWAMLIAYFRGYMNGEENSALYEKYAHMADGYDVIVGYIANDRMYQVLTDFFEKRITDAALIGSLSALKLGKQYVAVTQKACDQIQVLNENKLSKLELMILKDRSIVRRNEGISLAEQIVMEHRRDGRYFDEILRGVEI